MKYFAIAIFKGQAAGHEHPVQPQKSSRPSKKATKEHRKKSTKTGKVKSSNPRRSIPSKRSKKRDKKEEAGLVGFEEAMRDAIHEDVETGVMGNMISESRNLEHRSKVESKLSRSRSMAALRSSVEGDMNIEAGIDVEHLGDASIRTGASKKLSNSASRHNRIEDISLQREGQDRRPSNTFEGARPYRVSGNYKPAAASSYAKSSKRGTESKRSSGFMGSKSAHSKYLAHPTNEGSLSRSVGSLVAENDNPRSHNTVTRGSLGSRTGTRSPASAKRSEKLSDGRTWIRK